MRFRFLMLLPALALPMTLTAQATTRRARDVERFETSKLPASPASDLEKEIFGLLRLHKKGDLTDASRIHAKLGQYYREAGEKALSDQCNTMAMEAWSVASGERPASAGSPFTPPFEPANTLARGFFYLDDLKVEHTWDFFEDGTFSHVVIPEGENVGPAPRELGWYTVEGGSIRLWQAKPRMDRRMSFQLQGDGGRDGVVMDGVRMQAIK